MRPQNLESWQAELGAWLHENTRFWQPRPFILDRCPWEDELSDLAQEFRALSLEQIEGYEAEPHRFPSRNTTHKALKEKALELCALPDFGNTGTLTVKKGRGIKEKKWRQITAFAQAAAQPLSQSPAPKIFDWCGGKGHLGRSLALEHRRDLVVLDHDKDLLDAGATLAQKAGLRCDVIHKDALAPDAPQDLSPEHCAIALHACGQLHMTLAQIAARKQLPSLIMAPCCYHRISGERYHPLSKKTIDLKLTRELLKLATTEQVSPSKKVLRTRHRWMTWRLGFDLLLRKARGINEYTALPHFPATQSQLPFPDFCKELATQFQLPLPKHWNSDSILKVAEERARHARALALLRWLFRRPLEIWLCLDRALFLQDAGYEVQFGQFCARDVSPRNLMILARRT